MDLHKRYGIKTYLAERKAIQKRYPLALANWPQKIKAHIPHALKRRLSHYAQSGSDVSLGLHVCVDKPAIKN